MKRLLTAVALSLVCAGAARGQQPDFGPAIAGPAVTGLDGRWEGAIQTPEGLLTGVFRIATANGKTTTLMDSPTQNALNIPAIAKREGANILIDVPIVNGNLTGQLSADGASITGAWHQNGMDFPLILTRK